MMRTRDAVRAATAIVLAALASGCILVPVPTYEAAPRFSQEQIDAVGTEARTTDSIRAKLGPADLRRDDGRIWIYTWTEDYGAWVAVAVTRAGEALEGEPWGAVESRRFLWVMEFDAEGALARHEFIPDAKDRDDRRYCTRGRLCVEHGMMADDEEFGYRVVFDDQYSAVTARGEALERMSRPDPGADECLLVIWPESDWNLSGLRGLAFSVDGSSSWSSPHWVPAGAFARMVLPAGAHVVTARDPWWDVEVHQGSLGAHDFKTSAATFQCGAGERVFLSIGAVKNKDNGFPIVLRPVDATAAQPRVEDMAQVLPPD